MLLSVTPRKAQRDPLKPKLSRPPVPVLQALPARVEPLWRAAQCAVACVASPDPRPPGCLPPVCTGRDLCPTRLRVPTPGQDRPCPSQHQEELGSWGRKGLGEALQEVHDTDMHRALSCNCVGSPPSAPGIWPFISFPATVSLPSNVQPGARGWYCRPGRATGCRGLAGNRPGSPPMNARFYGPCPPLPPRPMGRLELPRAAACLRPSLTCPQGSLPQARGWRCHQVPAAHARGPGGGARFLPSTAWASWVSSRECPGKELSGDRLRHRCWPPAPTPAHLDGVRAASRPPDPVPRPQSSSAHPLL